MKTTYNDILSAIDKAQEEIIFAYDMLPAEVNDELKYNNFRLTMIEIINLKKAVEKKALELIG